METEIKTSMQMVSAHDRTILKDRIRGIDVTHLPKTKFKLLDLKAVDLTPSRAGKYLDMPQFAGERTLDIEHVVKLAAKLIAGQFLWPMVNIVVAFCKA